MCCGNARLCRVLGVLSFFNMLPASGMQIMKLYSYDLSGHAHRVRLLLSFLGVDYELVEVDLAKREQKSPDFLRLNSFGQVPVLVDGEVALSDSNAILVYLAKKYARTDWLPEDAAGAARVQKWLSVAAGEIARGPASARLVTVFKASVDADDAIKRAHAILALIEAQLAGGKYIVGDTPTIADVALYSYVSSAPEGNVDLSSYARVVSWLRRVEGLPNFVVFKRTPVGLAA
jgi:glutathione S-transferase